MNDLGGDGFRGNLHSLTQSAAAALWSQWQWWSVPWRFGITMMDALVVESNRSAAPAGAPDQPGALPRDRPSRRLEEQALERLQKGLAPPRDIYDVRNRGRIDWSKVPDWARPSDPELFEGCTHEG